MDDLISRQMAIDSIQYAGKIGKLTCIDILKRLPSAQPEPIKIQIDHELTHDEFERLRKDMADAPIVLLSSAQPEIIRCKDCKHYDGRPCGIVDWWNTDNDFCSKAERREE